MAEIINGVDEIETLLLINSTIFSNLLYKPPLNFGGQGSFLASFSMTKRSHYI
jgi:hypothetical protein